MASVSTAPTVALPEWVIPDGPLVAVWLDDDDPMFGEGPWRLLRNAAIRAGWSVDGFFSRGNTLTATGGAGALTDALSLRMRKGPGYLTVRQMQAGDIPPARYAVALWTRTTWPTLGRVRRDDDAQQGEGRRDNSGRTWLWHPPMALPAQPLPVGKWSFFAGWSWTSADRALVRHDASAVRRLITK